MSTKEAPEDFVAAGTLERPLVIGRAVRLVLAVVSGCFVWASVATIPVGKAPAPFTSALPFWLGALVVVWRMPSFTGIAFGKRHKRWPQALLIAGAVGAAAGDLATSGEVPDLWLGSLALPVVVGVCAYLAISLLVGGLLGVPG